MKFDYAQHAIDWWKKARNDTITSEILSDLTIYRNEHYGKFAEAYLKADYKTALQGLSAFPDGFDEKSSYIILDNATVNPNGVVAHDTFYLVPRSCLRCGLTRSCSNIQISSLNFIGRHIVDHCVTIAQYWGNTYYHFVGENLPRLMPLLPLIQTQNLAIHVHKRNSVAFQFLKLLKVDSQRIISGNIFATKLFVPESIACGNTPAYLLHEMRAAVLSRGTFKNIQGDISKCSIVTIKRQTRSILNHADMIKTLTYKFPWCSVLEHLGNEPVSKQLEMMHSASVLIAPHGAGLVNMFVCRRNTLIVEFLNRKRHTNMLFMFMSLKLGLRYIGISVLGHGEKHANKIIDISRLIQVIQQYNKKSYYSDSKIENDKELHSTQLATFSNTGSIRVCVVTGNERTASLFSGGIKGRLVRYGTGRYYYTWVGNNQQGRRKECWNSRLIVGDIGTKDAHVTMSTGDEFCRKRHNFAKHQPDLIQYWSDSNGLWNYTQSLIDKQTPIYFPLGARFEFKYVSATEIIRSHERKFLFNFIGTLGTSKSRIKMTKTLYALNTSKNTHLFQRGFIHTADHWQSNPNSAQGKYLTASQFRYVLLNSVLTLIPAGRNPECFRFYEALEAGSIPVIPLDDNYYKHPCKNALRPWIDSGVPAFFIRNWSEFPQIIANISKNPELVDKMQRSAITWYKSFMSRTALRLEELLDSHL